MAEIDTAGWTEVYGGFTHQDRQFYCSTSGQPVRPGEPMYRGSFVDLEGFYSVCLDSARQLARLIGFVDPAQVDMSIARQLELEEQVTQLQAANESLHTLIDHLRTYDETYTVVDEAVLTDEELGFTAEDLL